MDGLLIKSLHYWYILGRVFGQVWCGGTITTRSDTSMETTQHSLCSIYIYNLTYSAPATGAIRWVYPGLCWGGAKRQTSCDLCDLRFLVARRVSARDYGGMPSVAPCGWTWVSSTSRSGSAWWKATDQWEKECDFLRASAGLVTASD